MAKEVFSAIFEAEKVAAELVKEARRKAQDRLERADEESLKAVREVLDRTDREVARLKEAASAAGKEKSRPIMAAAEQEAAALLNLNGAQLEPAIAYVMEMVTNNGNR